MASLAADDPSLARSPGSSNPGISSDNGSVSQPPQPLSGLLSLPNELLQAIAAHLLPDAPSTTRFTLETDGSWKIKEAHDQWTEWKECYLDLQSFIQSCRRLTAVAGPYRYHSIVVHSGKSVVRLFRHLVERPEARQWIRNITCLANLVDETVVDETRQEWALLVQRGFRLPPDLFARPIIPQTVLTGFSRPSKPDNGIALTLFNRIVGFADNLSDLLLAYPDDIGATVEGSLEELMWYPTARPGFKLNGEDDIPLLDPSLFPTTTALQRLSSLRLYCHLQGNVQPFRADSYTQRFAAHIVALLPELRGLKSLEICCDAPSSWAPLLAEDHPQLPGVDTVKLYGSRIHEPELVALCRTFTHLQTLVVHFEESADDEQDRWRLPGGRTLDQALLGLADTLQHLELAIVADDAHYLTRGDERPRKRENHRLTCLPKLYNLHHLTVDLRGLFGTLGILEYDDGDRLRHLLPQSLRSLTLVCEWGTERDWKPVYLANLDMIFHGIRLLCSSRSPKLASLCLAMHKWPQEKDCKYRTKFRKSLDDIRARCKRTGIQFSTHDLLPSYWDEDSDLLEGVEGGEGEEGEGEEDDEEEGQNVGAQERDDEEEDSEYYFSGDGGDDLEDFERDARRPATFEAFLEQLGPNHGHDPDELYFAYYEERWDEYLF